MLAFALLVCAVLLVTLMVVFILNKTISEKIQTINSFNSIATIFIAIYCYYINKPQYIDIALTYAVLSYVSIVALKKYLVKEVKSTSNQDSNNNTQGN